MHSFVQIQRMAASRELCYNEMQPIDTTSSSPQSLQSLKELSFAVSAAHTLLSTHHSGVKTGVALAIRHESKLLHSGQRMCIKSS